MTGFTADVDGPDGLDRRGFAVARMYNLGSATRDPVVAEDHQREVADAGVRIAFDVPAPRIYPIAPWALTTGDEVAVQGPRTSGEVEIVLVVDDELYVGVGSDHTDRDLERVSIPWSKQSCPNVVAPRLWRWRDVADHWDVCTLTSTVDGRPYQDTSVAQFLHPDDVLATVRDRADVPERGVVVFCGTIVSVTAQLGFGSRWSFALRDPVLRRSLEHTYDVVELMGEIRPGFRVPLTAAGR